MDYRSIIFCIHCTRTNKDISQLSPGARHIQALSSPKRFAVTHIQTHHPNPVLTTVQCITFHHPHPLSPSLSAHNRSSFALLAISNASGGSSFTKMLQFLSSAMHSPSLPLSSSVSTHSDNVSTSFCTDCSLGEASCVLAMIWEVVDAMAARWSRISGASADVRMAETSAWMEGIKWSVRDSRKV